MHLKNDVIDGSTVSGVRQPIQFNFISDKPSGSKVFFEPETLHYKKTIKSILKTITFFPVNNKKEVHFIGKMLTFRLQMIKI